MTSPALQATRGNSTVAQAPAKKADPLLSIIDRVKPSIAQAMPKHLDVERVARIALTELRTNTRLAQAAQVNPASFMGALLKSSALGLEVGNGLGHAYLLPYKDETQLIIGYRGMIDLARRSGQVESLYAVEVYQGEAFKVSMGLNQDIQHERDFTGTISMSPDKVIAVYAVAKLKGGMTQFDVMTREQVEAIRKRSKSASSGPWVTDWVEMAKKTVLRRLFKMLPVSVEMQTSKGSTAVSLDSVDTDGQNGGGVIVDQDGVILNEGFANEAIDETQAEQQPIEGDLLS